MKILFAVMGALPHALNGIHQASRETWVRDAPQLGDFRFFIGHGDYQQQEDEVRVDIPDDKAHILYKTVEILKWAIDRGYDMILKTDTDTYVNINEMAKAVPGHDYVGSPVGTLGEIYAGTNCYSFIQGSATWLSARAARVVIDEAIPAMERIMPSAMRYNGLICPYPHSEDLWIAQALTPHLNAGSLRALSDNRYSYGPLTFHYGARPPALRTNPQGLFTWFRMLHESRSDVERMMRVHRESL